MEQVTIKKMFIFLLFLSSLETVADRVLKPISFDEIPLAQRDAYSDFFNTGNGAGSDLSYLDLRYAIVSLRERKGVSFRINCTYADISRANFSQANLFRANFLRSTAVGTYFAQANLSQANLCAANLSKAIFTGAQLTGANFTKANVTGANFSHADLTGADFRGAIIEGANFNNAILTGVVGLH
jgi:uncharacterized protein YjbI with pentapeptide repeats